MKNKMKTVKIALIFILTVLASSLFGYLMGYLFGIFGIILAGLGGWFISIYAGKFIKKVIDSGL